MIEGKGISNAGMVHLRAVPQLEGVDLINTIVTDAGLGRLAQIKTLKRLNLYQNKQITKKGLVHLDGLPALESLYIVGPKMTDKDMVHLGGLKKLKTLYLMQTEVTADRAQKLKKALPKVRISVK